MKDLRSVQTAGAFVETLALALIAVLGVVPCAFADAIRVPEPASLSLFAVGATGAIVARKLRWRK